MFSHVSVHGGVSQHALKKVVWTRGGCGQGEDVAKGVRAEGVWDSSRTAPSTQNPLDGH